MYLFFICVKKLVHIYFNHFEFLFCVGKHKKAPTVVVYEQIQHAVMWAVMFDIPLLLPIYLALITQIKQFFVHG